MVQPNDNVTLSPAFTDFRNEMLPPFNPAHIFNLTDDTGMIQHALRSIPNRKEGYCLDDNARALLLATMAWKQQKDNTLLKQIHTYLSFVHYIQMPEGNFGNFMSYTKTILEEPGSEDAFGRTLMALGYLLNEGPSQLMIRAAEEIFLRAYPHIHQLNSPRGIANSLIGICLFIRFNYPDDLKKENVVQLAEKLIILYQAHTTDTWQWFEDILTYDNAILPLALLHAYETTGREDYLQIGMDALHFLASKVFIDGMFRPIGNLGWLQKNGVSAQFDQQPVEAMTMILLYEQAFRITGDTQLRAALYQCYQWFLGANDLELPLYDPNTGGCADGLQEDGLNNNQGAESTISYWISHLVVADLLNPSL